MKTVEEIYGEMAERFTQETGMEVNGTGEMAVRLYALAAQVYGLFEENEWTKKQCFPQTATGEELEAVVRTEPEPTEPRKGRTSRVERMFGKKEYWIEPAASPQDDGEPRPVKGFVFIKCQHCGAMRSTFLKNPQTEYRCRDCGGFTPIDFFSLRSAYAKCSVCENDIKYKTNAESETIEIPCKKCGAPIDLRLNGKGTAYTTVYRRHGDDKEKTFRCVWGRRKTE